MVELIKIYGKDWSKISAVMNIDPQKLRNRFYSRLNINEDFKIVNEQFRIRAPRSKIM